ncbi:MAG TPA: YfaZ family outer membrane protein [Woeseiaceae bacterium]|nr:YfaZ family outer membrane protein [Woeseiaceae bacterium]
MPLRSSLLCALLVAAHSFPAPARAQGAAEVTLSDEAMQLRYLAPWAPARGVAGEVGLGVFLNEDRDLVISAQYFFEANRLGNRRLTIKAGPVGYGAMLGDENTDVFSIALGAEARFELLRRQEIYLVARFAYAPDILTFGTADNLTDFTAQVELPLTNRLIGIAGYRRFEFELLEGDREIEDSLELGIRYRF